MNKPNKNKLIKDKVITYHQEDILNKINERIDGELEYYEKSIKVADTKLKEDYTWNFANYGDIKFKAEYTVTLIKMLRQNCNIVKDKHELVPELFKYLKRREDETIYLIIESKPILASTSILSRVTEGWKQECYRVYLELIKSLQAAIIYRKDNIVYSGKENLSTLLS
jgi:hypothetical protein